LTGTLKPIGIFGGTFDPIHFGHLRLAQESVDAFNLDSVLFIPTGIPPHKQLPQANARHRLEMAKLATKNNSKFIVDEREIRGNEICYSFDTLTKLRREFGAERPLYFLMGTDAFRELSSWYRWNELFSLAHIIVSNRPGCSTEDSEPSLPKTLNAEIQDRITLDVSVIANHAQGKIFFQATTLLDISASHIRKCIRAGKNIRYLLPGAVLDYIQLNQLYQNNDANR